MKKVRTKLFQEVTSKVKNAVKRFDPNAEVVLFGSRARGDYSSESDWDFLILTDSVATNDYKDSLRDYLFDTELELEQVVSTIIKNKKDWFKSTVLPLFQNISEDGVKL